MHFEGVPAQQREERDQAKAYLGYMELSLVLSALPAKEIMQRACSISCCSGPRVVQLVDPVLSEKHLHKAQRQAISGVAKGSGN